MEKCLTRWHEEEDFRDAEIGEATKKEKIKGTKTNQELEKKTLPDFRHLAKPTENNFVI